MKTVLYIFTITLFASCIVQKEEFKLIPNQENNCYWTEELIVDVHNQNIDYIEFDKSFILEIIPPEFEVDSINFDNPSLNIKKFDSTRYRVITYDKYSYRFDHKTAKCYYDKHKRKGYRICYGWQPEINIITNEQLENSDYKIEIKRQISNSKLLKKYVKREPDSVDINQIYVQKGKYFDYSTRSNICNKGPNQLLSPIKFLTNFLINQGYEIEDSLKWNQDVTDALKDFQNNNNITSELGELGYETAKLIEEIEFIPKLIKLGYEINDTKSWTVEANKALIDFQTKNKLLNNIGELDYKTRRQMEEVEYIPKLKELGYDIDEHKYWSEKGKKALIDYQIEYDLLINIGDLDHKTKQHIKQSIAIPVDNK